MKKSPKREYLILLMLSSIPSFLAICHGINLIHHDRITGILMFLMSFPLVIISKEMITILVKKVSSDYRELYWKYGLKLIRYLVYLTIPILSIYVLLFDESDLAQCLVLLGLSGITVYCHFVLFDD